MEQTRVEAQLNHIWPLLVAGDTRWKDYTFEASVRFLSTRGQTGIVFRYTHGRRYYFFGYGSGKLQLLKRNQEQIEQLAAGGFHMQLRLHLPLPPSSCAAVKSSVTSMTTGCWKRRTAHMKAGKIGLTARMPCPIYGYRRDDG